MVMSILLYLRIFFIHLASVWLNIIDIVWQDGDEDKDESDDEEEEDFRDTGFAAKCEKDVYVLITFIAFLNHILEI